jgi:hypothetical protein
LVLRLVFLFYLNSFRSRTIGSKQRHWGPDDQRINLIGDFS